MEAVELAAAAAACWTFFFARAREFQEHGRAFSSTQFSKKLDLRSQDSMPANGTRVRKSKSEKNLASNSILNFVIWYIWYSFRYYIFAFVLWVQYGMTVRSKWEYLGKRSINFFTSINGYFDILHHFWQETLKAIKVISHNGHNWRQMVQVASVKGFHTTYVLLRN